MVETAVIGAGIKDERVIKSLMETPRHEFIPRKLRKEQAYLDAGIPIGESQTISSPFIVAYMTESLDPRPDDRVLEIGTGSGYQAAVLSPLVKDVYSIEIVEPLGKRAKKTLESLDYDNVHVRIGDGYKGWPKYAPFDKIIVTCSPEDVPKPLADQLAEGGLMVVPMGERHQQTLYLLTKKDGKLVKKALRPTLFVPMTGNAEAKRRVFPDPENPKILNGDFEVAAFLSARWSYEIGRLAMAFGHLGLILLICRMNWIPIVTSALAAVGRMALTNYILQTFFCITLFCGFGFGWFGELERYQLYFVVASIWCFQIAFSIIWLHCFRFGPLEWGWRSLTYWQLQPMRNERADVAPGNLGIQQ